MENKLWWLSFADEDGNRGVVLTEAPSFLRAVAGTLIRNINPGGEAMGFVVELGGEDDVFPHDTLIPLADLVAKGYFTQKVEGLVAKIDDEKI